MKKIILLSLISLISLNSAYALKLTSDTNGPVTISEPQLKVGEKAPEITLTTSDFKQQKIGGASGKVQIISTIESFNTPVCDDQTMILNKVAKELKNTQISVITANMPFIIDAYKTKHKINNISLLSTFNNDTFGKKYGLQVVDGELTGILARSIFIVDKNGIIIYKDISSNIDHMPNMKKAIQIAERAENDTKNQE